MDIQTLFSLTLFSLATLGSPGPNNLMLMASGANFGLRRTFPHMAGVAYGFPLMVLGVGVGVMQIFALWPVTETILKFVSVAYLLWLAWKIARADAPGKGRSGARPLSFLQAAAFQWVNPKAWSMAIAAVTLYAPDRSVGAILLVVISFALFGSLTAPFWTSLGTVVRRWLDQPGRLRLFNRTAAALLVLSMVPLLAGA
ncbi:LysE family translocator [Palleronia caenipelagi]|uniref:LysE family translocator n=1 Tax=Palleronia caenipelagi TaxID=2489174 RepID=A0A547QA98_9RHOB|nr:LysE family translocator [Palleronia caenipelagi]TRD23289.1 LysE family translocator [Palleronia caenipelagi]